MKHRALRGFSLITAIFLLVMVASLSAVMVPFFTAQQQSSALDVTGSQAYHAAVAGIEWSAFQIAPNSLSGSTAPPVGTPSPFATQCQGSIYPAFIQAASQPVFTGTLSQYNVAVTCSATPQYNAATTPTVNVNPPLWIYTVMATASSVGGTDSVKRMVQATIADGGGISASGVVNMSETY